MSHFTFDKENNCLCYIESSVDKDIEFSNYFCEVFYETFDFYL